MTRQTLNAIRRITPFIDHQRGIILAGICVCFAIIPAYGQSTPVSSTQPSTPTQPVAENSASHPLSPTSLKTDNLSAALYDAYRSNPELQAARAQLLAVGEGVAQARSGYLPNLNLNGSLEYGVGLGTDILNWADRRETSRQSIGLQLSQMIYDFGRTESAVEAAQARVLAQRARLADQEQALLQRVANAYLAVIRDQEIAVLTHESLQSLKQEQSATQQRFHLGEATRTDLSQAAASVANAQSQFTQAYAALGNSKEAFRNIVGRFPNTLQPPPRLPKIPASLETAERLAQTQHFSVLTAQAQELIAQADLQAATRALAPNITLDGRAAHQIGGGVPNNSSVNFSINITAPLYQGGRSNSQIRNAQNIVLQRKFEIRQAKRQAITQASNAWRQILAAKTSIRTGLRQVQASQTAYQGVQIEVNLGTRAPVELWRAERDRLQARINLVQAQYNIHASVYSLLYAISYLDSERLGIGESFAIRATVIPEQSTGYQFFEQTSWQFPW